MIFVIDPDRRVTPSQTALMHLFDLTPTESRLALLLAGGKTIEAAGRTMGIATNTARVHIKSVFRKMDVNRQGDLIRVILNTAAVLERAPRWPNRG